MRKNVLYTLMAVFGLLGFHAGNASAASSTNALTVKFSLTASVQGPVDTVTNANSTNVTYTVNKFRFANKDMLNLLANEFGTAFPDGAQLGLTPAGFEFVVLDKAGNIFLNVSTNSDPSYVFSITNNSARIGMVKFSAVPNKTTTTYNQIQPDFAIYYADGKGNNFHFGGLLNIKYAQVTEGGVTSYKAVSLTVSSSGAGALLNPGDEKYEPAVLTGPWMATAANLY